MNTDNLGKRRGNNQNQQNQGHKCFINHLLIGIHLSYFLEKRPHHHKHDYDIKGSQPDGIKSAGKCSGLGNGYDYSQQTPGSDIIIGSRSDGQSSQRSFRHIPFLNDAGQYRESGNTHRDTDEKGKRQETCLGSGIFFINPVRCDDAKKERNQYTCMADDQCFVDLVFKYTEIEFHSDHKHEKYQTDLAQ